MSRPSTPPGPIRPLMSAEVIAFRCQPWAACSLRIFSSFSPDILPPSIFSRTSTTLYSNAMDPTVAGPVRSAGGVGDDAHLVDRVAVGALEVAVAMGEPGVQHDDRLPEDRGLEGGVLDVVGRPRGQQGVAGVAAGLDLVGRVAGAAGHGGTSG